MTHLRLFLSRLVAFQHRDFRLFWLGLLPVWGLPATSIALSERYVLLAFYVVASAGALAALQIGFCARCMNFACPLNRVDDEGRAAFLTRNPWVADAWGAEDEIG